MRSSMKWKYSVLCFILLFNLTVSQAQAKSMSGQTIGIWQVVSQLPKAREDFAIIQTDHFLYMIGGCITDCFYGAMAAVERAPILPDNTIGSWTKVNDLTMPRQGASAVLVENTIYVLGGSPGSILNSVEKASINADGSLSDWQLVNTMQTPRMRFSTLLIGDYIYAIGGLNNEGVIASVERAQIHEDGSLGVWEYAPSLVKGRGEFYAFRSGNHVYALGGDIYDNNAYASSSDIERAAINPDGSLQNWQIVSSMGIGRHSFSAVHTSNAVYVMGGNTSQEGSTTFQKTVEKITVAEDGFIGPVEPMPSLNVERNLSGAVIIGDYIYAISGYAINTPQKSVERAQIINDSSIPVIEKFEINGGAASTTSAEVTLNVTAADTQSSIRSIQFSNEGQTWSGWYPFASSIQWTLSGPDGAKTVYANVLDSSGNKSETKTASITLDREAAVYYGLTINNGALFTNQTGVTLKIGAMPGTSMMMVSNDGGFAGSAWEPYSSTRSWQIIGYGNYVIPRVVYIRYKDATGNVTAVYQDDIILDVNPPSGNISITTGVSGALVAENARLFSLSTASSDFSIFLPAVFNDYCYMETGADNVTLNLSATDDLSGVSKMQISNYADFRCAKWIPYALSKNWYLPSLDRTLYVKFIDHAGNISEVITGKVN